MTSKKPLITKTNVILVVVILILLWFSTCNPFSSNPIEQPVSVEKVREVIVKDTLLAAKIRDSFTLILNKRYALDKVNIDKTDRLMAENIQLYNDNIRLQTPDYADTCKPVVDFLNKKYNDYASQTQKTLSQTNRTISGLSNTVSTQKSTLAKEKALYNILRKDVDTCLSVAKKWEDYARKIKSKREIYLSVMGLGNENKIVNGYGLGIGYRGKNGTAFEIGAIQIGSTINYSISVKKPLIRF